MVKPQINKQILSTNISLISIEDFLQYVFSKKNLSVAVCNINTLVSADRDKQLNEIINNFDLRVADGMPLVWYLNFNKIKQERLNGAKIFFRVIEEGLSKNLKHYFLGSTDEVLLKMTKNLKKKYPEINIAGYFSPPVGTAYYIKQQSLKELKQIEECDILWVGLGMPKQEQFINLLGDLETIKIGVGAVFEWVAGTKKQAPKVLQNAGLEWFYRLISEPRRLWKRYFFDFIYLVRYSLKKVLKK